MRRHPLIANGMRNAVAILCIFGCPLAKAQTSKTSNSANVLPPGPQPYTSPGGVGFVLQPSATQNGTTADENGWVRGSASLSKATGVVDFCVRMASDSLKYGPKARMSVALRDSNDKDIADIAVGEIGRGGRAHGKAENDVNKFCGQATVSPEIAARTTGVDIAVQITGIVTKRLGIDADDAIDGSKIVVNLP
jgi:hypothetical protein